VRVSRGASFRFEAAVETLVDLDGETVGRLPLEVPVVPRGFSAGKLDQAWIKWVNSVDATIHRHRHNFGTGFAL
jgi:hypothetical protein